MTKRKAKKKPAKREKSFNRHRAARVLVEATLTDDAKAARAHGVSAASVAGWRRRLETDPELAREYASQLARVDGRWREELRELVLAGARKLRSLVEMVEEPEMIPEVINAVRTGGELLISYEALVADYADPGEGREAATAAQGAGQAAPSVH